MILSISEQELRYLNYPVCCRMDDVQRKLNREHRRYDRSQTSIDALLDLEAEMKLVGDLHDKFLNLRLQLGFYHY